MSLLTLLLLAAVVHFIKTTESGVQELPLVLQGIIPEKVVSNVGSGNVAGLAKAVILGGGYEEEDYKTMRAAVDKAALQHRPVWMMRDSEKWSPPPGPGYGAHIAERVRDLLAKLNEEGKLDGSDGSLHWY